MPELVSRAPRTSGAADDAASAPAAFHAGRARLAVVALIGTFAIIAAGAQVTTTLAGDSIPTWPASLYIPGTSHQWYELSHRWIVGPMGTLGAILGLWVALKDRRAAVRKLGLWTAIAVVVQALIGGRRVLLGESHSNVWPVLHTMLGQTYLAMVAALATLLGKAQFDDGSPRLLESGTTLAARARVLWACVWGQALLGALLRHVVQDRNPAGIVAHAAGALVVSVAAFLAADAAIAVGADEPRLRRPALLVLALIAAQILLGFAAWLVTHLAEGYSNPQDASSLFPTLHVLNGAGILSAATWLALEARPRTR
jgi:heme A synthase